ncbi:MAG: class I tRNA ligase family protein [Planctomycetota bacterium]|nr:class I tRNA ligase family protein [Planctomycetota bacterium]
MDDLFRYRRRFFGQISMFESVAGNVNFPTLENEIGRFWRERRIYDLSLAQRAGSPRFVFYEGPPTANGMPHPGHCLTRSIKDLYPRYRTMRGYLCERKAGWDTHGLPVEVEVCKELGIHSKEEIEAYGIEPFIHRCQASVWRYMQEWERLTERLGFWIKLDEAYVTYHQSFIESVWWSLKQLFDRGLLYQGHKIVWRWAQGGTALSAGEVGQGYREVADPSVYVKFPLVADAKTKALDLTGASLLVWTTTPWTLPSNQFAAVNPELEYAVVVDPELPDERLIIAAALVETIAKKIGRELVVSKTVPGADLIGCRYVPPFDNYYATQGTQQGTHKSSGKQQHLAWRVVGAPFVTTDSGSGVVHQAPAFGEVDFQVLQDEQARFEKDGPQLICAVSPDGKFTAEGPDYCRGRWVKDCDREIIRDLKDRGLLYHREEYRHEYPFCWRAEQDPLIQYPRQSWFIKTTAFKDQMLANNEQINWLPEHIKHGRFGNFLETNVDWALSRERYWGTPLPIWQCTGCGRMEAVECYDDLLTKPGMTGAEVWQTAKQNDPSLVDDLRVHKPYIDAITFDSTCCTDGARMQRVPDVIDCWYDSGAMPFAQWGYRGETGPAAARENFHQQFPADFISEAIDQTRGWFYSQLAISTLLFGGKSAAPEAAPVGEVQGSMLRPAAAKGAPAHVYPHPFRNCIVLGLMLGEDGQKMSKSKRNYREPNEIFDKYGADALRWYFFANQPPWTSIRYSEQAIKESVPEFLLRLWNVYSFFTIYANIDEFDPAKSITGDAGQLELALLQRAKGYRPLTKRRELDRWILSELHLTAATVIERMDAYDNYAACAVLREFVDALSNWYVRRSRDRFWTEDKQDPDKIDAYWTLYECLLTTCKLVAPFTPFVAEAVWQNLAVKVFGNRVIESVHLCDYPAGDPQFIDRELSRRSRTVREIASLGRAARTSSRLKVRQPLSKVEVILADRSAQPWLTDHLQLICEELNVKQVEFAANADQYITYSVLPDLKRLGPKLGKRLPAMKAAIAKADAAQLLHDLEENSLVTIELPDGPVQLDREDLQVRMAAKPGWAAAQGKEAVVVLATELNDELICEGLAREVTHSIQTRRKELGLNFTDRVAIEIRSDDELLRRAIDENRAWIQGEVLATQLNCGPTSEEFPSINCDPVELTVEGHALHLAVKVVI